MHEDPLEEVDFWIEVRDPHIFPITRIILLLQKMILISLDQEGSQLGGGPNDRVLAINSRNSDISQNFCKFLSQLFLLKRIPNKVRDIFQSTSSHVVVDFIPKNRPKVGHEGTKPPSKGREIQDP